MCVHMCIYTYVFIQIHTYIEHLCSTLHLIILIYKIFQESLAMLR